MWWMYFIEHNRYLNFLGIIVILAIAALFSRKRSAINIRVILSALVLQSALAFCILKTNLGLSLVGSIATHIDTLYSFAQDGIRFVFGSLNNPLGQWGFIFAIRVLPVVIFFSSLTSLLFYMGIIQYAVSAVSLLIRPLLGTSGAETLCAIANSFLGQTEAPLVIRHYLSTMTKSEMLTVMVSGMGTISGSILAVFAAMGIPAQHLLAASVMAIPSTLLIAKILYPETEQPRTMHGASVASAPSARNVLDAISMGTSDGLQLALNIGAMLIAFLALISLLNSTLIWVSSGIAGVLLRLGLDTTFPVLTLNTIFAFLFAPFGYLLGLTGTEALKAGELLGIKVALNEMVAYSKIPEMGLSPRALALLTYALCGFSNFSCIGIQIGGIGALAPEKRPWLSELGLLAVLGGTLSNLLSAMIAGLLL